MFKTKTFKRYTIFFLLLFYTVASSNIHAQKLYGLTSAGGVNGGGALIEYDFNTQRLTSPAPISFESEIPGRRPEYTTMVKMGDYLFGMTRFGGSYDAGVIFRYEPNTKAYTLLHNFDITNGGFPNGSLTAYNGKLLGMTDGGGNDNDGVIFQFDPTTQDYTTLAVLDSANGSNPSGNLIAYNNKFYGMTRFGGTYNEGTIFSFDLTEGYTKLADFDSINGGNPYGSLTAHDEKLYGMTNFEGENNKGTFFEFDPSTNEFSKIIHFNEENGASPRGNLTVYNNELYGMTNGGGNNRYGVLFSYRPGTDTLVIRHRFERTTGENPKGSLILFNNKLYGVTERGGSGVAFEFDPATDTYSKIADFNGNNGRRPLGSLTIFEDRLYGLTPSGGKAGYGVIFKLDIAAKQIIKQLDFDGERPLGGLTNYEGKLYGMTRTGGKNDWGSIFSYDPRTGIHNLLHSFDSINGRRPEGGLTVFNDKLYGITRQGGINNKGILFEYDLQTNILSKRLSFSNKLVFSGSVLFPSYSDLLVYDNKLYGTVSIGGLNGRGVIYNFNPINSEFTVIHDFMRDAGAPNPNGNIYILDNRLYGVQQFAGEGFYGSFYAFDLLSNKFNQKYFTVNSLPYSGLAVISNKLYGTTMSSQAIFSYDIEQDFLVDNIFEFRSLGISAPSGGMMTYQNKLYGISQRGGELGKGVIFEFNPKESNYIKLDDFNGINGSDSFNGSLTPYEDTTQNLALKSAYTDDTHLTLFWDFGMPTNDLTYELWQYSEEDWLKYSLGTTTDTSWQFPDYSACTNQYFYVVATNPSGTVMTSNTLKVVAKDILPPLVSLPDSIMVAGCDTLLIPPTAQDNCVGEVIATTSDELYFSGKGTYQVNWDFQDAHGNSTVFVQTIIIEKAQKLWYADADGDGFGNGSSPLLSCTTPEGYVQDSTDCDDTNISIFPNAEEINDGIDNNCDGIIDEPNLFELAISLKQEDGIELKQAEIFIYATDSLTPLRQKSWHDTTDIFTSLELDSYIIKVVPDSILYPTLLPTYSGNTLLRSEADVFSISSDTLYAITLQEKPQENVGTGSIEGIVLLQIGESDGRLLQGLESDGKPISEVTVYAVSVSTDKVVSTATSDAQGRFKINDLEQDKYILKVDYQGKPMNIDNAQIEISTSNEPSSVSIIIEQESIRTQVETVTALGKASVNNIAVYPNPVKNILKIDFAESREKRIISIVDQTGKRVLNKTLGSKAQNCELNLKDIPSGIYTIRVDGTKTSFITKIVKI